MGLSSHLINNVFASSCFHSSPPFSPYTLILIQFSSPAAICDAISTPLAPFSNFINTAPSSSSILPSTKIFKSAQSFVTFMPVTYSAILKACVPISPMAPAIPLFLGSVRHDACALPSLSFNVLSHPCGYSTYTFLIFPNTPFAIICLACFIIGKPV